MHLCFDEEMQVTMTYPEYPNSRDRSIKVDNSIPLVNIIYI